MQDDGLSPRQRRKQELLRRQQEEEMKRISASIRNRQRGNLGYIEGIETIQIRFGKEENKEFQLLQDELAEQQYP